MREWYKGGCEGTWGLAWTCGGRRGVKDEGKCGWRVKGLDRGGILGAFGGRLGDWD